MKKFKLYFKNWYSTAEIFMLNIDKMAVLLFFLRFQCFQQAKLSEVVFNRMR